MWPAKETTRAYYDSFRNESDRFAEIKAAISKSGFWQERLEWRISTERISTIKSVEVNGQKMFRLSVKCDCTFECYCPTLERAVEFEQIFGRLTSDLFHHFGWAGCAAKDRRVPSEGETEAT